MLVNARAVEVSRHRHLRGCSQASNQGVQLGSSQLLTNVIHSAGTFLERIVLGENVSDSCDDLSGGRRDQQRRQRRVICAEPLRDRERHAVPQTARLREENLLFHGDVPQQPSPESAVWFDIDRRRSPDRALQQIVEAFVVLLKKLVQGAWHAVSQGSVSATAAEVHRR